MTLWDFLHQHPVWGLVYLVISVLGASLALSTISAAVRRHGEKDEDEDGDLG